jgi:hypothetical protein
MTLIRSFRGALKARTRNPDGSAVCVSGFRVRPFGPSRNDPLCVMAGLVPAIHVFDAVATERRGCPA